MRLSEGPFSASRATPMPTGDQVTRLVHDVHARVPDGMNAARLARGPLVAAG
jgi:hypothetical protein